MALMQNLRSLAHDLTGYLVYILIIGTVGPFLFGYHLAELNAPQDVITCIKRSITVTAPGSLPQCMPMTAIQIGVVSSAFTVGGLCGALGAGPLTARYGRLQPMRFMTIFSIIGPVAEALAPNIAVLVLGRFVSGIGAGAALVVVPLYISEISPARQKGFFGAFTQIMTNMGILTAQLLGYFLSHDSMWRLILAIGGLFAILQLCGLVFAIDSPQWQADNGQPGLAKANLKRIRGRKADISDETKAWPSEDGEDSDEHDALLTHEHGHTIENRRFSTRSVTVGTFQVLREPQYRHPTLLAMMVLAIQQFCGINSIVMYGVSLLSGILKAHSAVLVIFVSLLNVVLTTACAPLLDIMGRKFCLLGSIAGMGTASFLLAIGIRGSIPILSTIAVLLFVGSFALGLGPVPFMLASELVGSEAVGATQSWALASNWVATFIVAQFFPLVNQRLGPGMVYFVFGGLSVLFFGLVFFLVPETKGKKNADEVWGRVPQNRDD